MNLFTLYNELIKYYNYRRLLLKIQQKLILSQSMYFEIKTNTQTKTPSSQDISVGQTRNTE